MKGEIRLRLTLPDGSKGMLIARPERVGEWIMHRAELAGASVMVPATKACYMGFPMKEAMFAAVDAAFPGKGNEEARKGLYRQIEDREYEGKILSE